MILTKKQEEGLAAAVRRFHDREPYTVISGYAGSGKSTLIKFIIAALGVEDDKVAYVAFTGKAANVLKQKGCPNATTAHKLLYKARPLPDGSYIFIAREELEAPYEVIIVDEVSMLPAQMWELLLSHGVYILAMGDPGQLPPINPEDDNHVLDNPHVFLDEIMRQAQESEIIRLSMHVRDGQSISSFEASGQQVKILTANQLVSGVYEWPDQILCATNRKRNEINQIVRNLRGYGDYPCEGDKIISLKNHWDIYSDNEDSPLTNGAIGYLKTCSVQTIYVPKFIYDKPLNILVSDVETEDGDRFGGLCLDYQALVTGEKALSTKQEYLMNKNKRCMNAPLEFVYGYAITGHKAQGSEWEKVLAFEERFPFSAEDHKRWLYTVITRASDKLVIVKS